MQVSKPGSNPFKTSLRVSSMRLVAERLSLIVATGEKEPFAADRLLAVVRRTADVMCNIGRAADAKAAKKMMGLLLGAFTIGKIVVRRVQTVQENKKAHPEAVLRYGFELL